MKARNATLIFNPHAGRRRDHVQLTPALIAALAGCGIHADAFETQGRGTAGILAARAAASGSDIVFACGGDGTVHEVLQGLVGTATALGIAPLGTANALARNPISPPTRFRRSFSKQMPGPRESPSARSHTPVHPTPGGKSSPDAISP